MKNLDKIILTGLAIPFQNKANLNGRRYSKDSFSTEAIQKMKDHIDKGEFLGESHMPQDGRSEIDMMRVSHRVIDASIGNKGMEVSIEVLDTPQGKYIKEMIEAGVNLTIASRSMGNIDASGLCHIDEIISYDLVWKPAFPDNFLKRLDY